MKHKNPFYKYAEYRRGFRDEVYVQAVTTAYNRLLKKEAIEDKAIHIVEIGGIRSLSKHSRFSDGWSTMVMLQTALNLGAEIDIEVCDLDNLFGIYSALFDESGTVVTEPNTSYLYGHNGSIKHKKIDEFSYDWTIRLRKDHGPQFLDVIAEAVNVDIFVLDGSDDPRQTKDQFEWARESNPDAIIVFDDWDIKGKLVKEVYMPHCPSNFKEHTLPYEYDGIRGTHHMATFDPLHSSFGMLKLS